MSIVGPNTISNENNNKIVGLSDPVNHQDAVTKIYCDNNCLHSEMNCLSIVGNNIMYSDINMNNHKIINLVDPTNDQDAATKRYIDMKCNSLLSTIENIRKQNK